MKQNYDVEILIDKSSREMLFAEMLRYKLEKIGYKCVINHQDIFTTPWGYDFFKKTNKNVKFILTPSFSYPRSKDIISRAYRQNSKIVVYHSEQFYPDFFLNEKLSLNYKSDYNRWVKEHLVWGEYYKKIILDHYPSIEDKISVVGNYKLSLVSDLKKTHLDKKYALVVSNFLLGDYSNKDYRYFKKKYKVKSSYPLNTKIKQIRNEFLSELEYIIKEVDNYNFILRPHPGEDLTIYSEFEKSFSNVTISYGNELKDDLAKSDIVLMHSSSSIFEAITSGLKVISLEVSTKLDKAWQQKPTSIFRWHKKNEIIDIFQNNNNSVDKKYDLEYYSGDYKNTLNNVTKNLDILLSDKNSKENITFQDFKLISKYYIEVILKDAFLKFGYILYHLSLYDGIYKWAMKHLKKRISKVDHIPRRHTYKNSKIKSQLLKLENE